MAKLTIKNFEIELSKLHGNPKNPRQISDSDLANLKKSLQEFPEMREIREIVIDEDYMILGGHQRVRALMELGETVAPVKQVIGLTEEQKDEFTVKDNVQHGDWDWEKLELFEEQNLLDWGFEGFFGEPDTDDARVTENPISKQRANNLYNLRCDLTDEQHDLVLRAFKTMSLPKELDGNTNLNGIAVYTLCKEFLDNFQTE